MLRSTRRRGVPLLQRKTRAGGCVLFKQRRRERDSLNVWGNDVGYLKGKIDPYEGKIASIIPRYNWSTTFTASELTTLLNNRGYGIGTVKNAYVSAYTDTGNVYSVTFTGTSGSKTVSREACRTLLNLRSQRFTISGGGARTLTA